MRLFTRLPVLAPSLPPLTGMLSILGVLIAGGCASVDAAMHSPPSAVVTESRAIDLQLGGK